MSIRMLIDASHQEETRVAIVDGNRVEDFDYESSSKKQLKGSIYLAKVTRVEPSLQAAFVDYGGNRHGFLAFSEIHPDYYQIPVADREALIAQEAAANADLLENEEPEDEKPKKKRRRTRRPKVQSEEAPSENTVKADGANSEDTTSSEGSTEAKENKENVSDDKKEIEKDAIENSNDSSEEPSADIAAETEETEKKKPRRRKPRTKAESTKTDEVIVDDAEQSENNQDAQGDTAIEETSSDNDAQVNAEENDEDDTESDNSESKDTSNSDEDEEERLRIRMAKRLRYKYKIQEVIKKNQIILIQVVKEERGNKGAALTTYLSLPGRYCVLMPNTLHGGGVSRKIANIKDRKKLKNILTSLNMPKGHACIIRTAGSDRTKAEIIRDYDYLKRMWEAIRELTLKSIAPSQIYEEGNLIKRSLRDLYTRDVAEILVEGERGFNTAKTFMKMLMPTHAKKIHHYEDQIPLFQRYRVESHLDSMYSPTAQLKSGGYIVINPTEALVSIDVNSGRATKEHNIEETALKTNLEAAEEVARQLKLRDMAGLVVIDFIDMEENRNNRAVERKMKECLKSDRARIQVGRISSFGLMEMSRQRIRVGVLESSTTPCPHCEGSGLLRTVESQSLHILRIIEEEGIRAKNSRFTVYLPSRVAVYVLNHKRNSLTDLEQRYDFSVTIEIDDDLTASAYRMDKAGKPSKTSQKRKDSLKLGRDVNTLIDVTEEDVSPGEENKDRPKRRRRRKRGQHNRQNNAQTDQSQSTDNNADEKTTDNQETPPATQESSAADNQDRPRRRRRPRRGKRRDEGNNIEATPNATDEAPNSSEGTAKSSSESSDTPSNETPSDEAPKRRPRRTRKPRVKVDDAVASTDTPVVQEQKVEDEKVEKPKRVRKPRAPKKVAEEVKVDSATEEKPSKAVAEKPKRAPRKRAPKKEPETEPVSKPQDAKPETADPVEKPKPKKKGWWSR